MIVVHHVDSRNRVLLVQLEAFQSALALAIVVAISLTDITWLAFGATAPTLVVQGLQSEPIWIVTEVPIF